MPINFTNSINKKWIKLCPISRLRNDKFFIKKIDRKSFGAIKINGKVKVIRNICPHAGAEICKGKINKLVLSNKKNQLIFKNKLVLQCPWHGWEFFLSNGFAVHSSNNKLQLSIVNCKIYNKYVHIKI